MYLCTNKNKDCMARKRNKRNSPTLWYIVVIIALVAAGLSYWQESNDGARQDKQAESFAATVPMESDVSASEVLPTEGWELAQVDSACAEQIIVHTGYTVSYNPLLMVPNWVAYELTDAETSGEGKRSDHFLPDPLVEGDAVVSADYKSSGYDRGHMAPAGDMKWSEQAMKESFYMTNMCPQLHNVNAGDWKELEDLARSWAKQYGNIYITCGPIVEENHQTIGTTRKIAVPAAFYKVFLRPTEDGWGSIGFVLPNRAGSRPLLTYIASVDEIEALTGIDFFYSLPDDVEETIEAQCEPASWALSRKAQ